MSDGKEIVIVENVQLGALQVAPEAVVKRAATIAKTLAQVVKQQKLYRKIGNKEYVYVDGWTTLGAMVGVVPRERSSTPIDKGGSVLNGYEAYIELIRTSDDAVIGGASAICTRGEKNWKDRDDYAIKSMAATRATGKAFRLSLSWIMQMAGFATTPAEEMEGVVNGEFRETASSGPRTKNQWEKPVLDKIMDLQLVKARPHAVNILNRSPFMDVPYGQLKPQDAVAFILGWEEVKKNNPKMDTNERIPYVMDAWGDVSNRGAWLSKALDLLGGE